MALSCDLASLTAASRCFNCLSATEKEALKVYFMAQTLKAAGGPDLTDLNVRNQASACLACEPDFVLDSIETATWQNLAINMGSILPTSISDLRKLVRCAPCGEQKTTRAAFITLLCRLLGISNPLRETDAWAVRVVLNGGPVPSQNTLNAANTFLNSISSLRSRIYHLNFIAPDSIIAMRTPLIKTIGFDPWLPKIIGAGFAETIGPNGWRGAADAANGIVYDTGVNPSSISSFNISNGGISIYIAANGLTDSPIIAAGAGAGATGIEIAAAYPVASSFLQLYDAGTVLTPINTCGGGCGGFYMGVRTAVNRNNLYSARSNFAWQSFSTSAGNNTTLPPSITIAFGGHNTGLGFNLCPHFPFSFFAIHDGFSSADGQTLFNAVQALRVALGGGFL